MGRRRFSGFVALLFILALGFVPAHSVRADGIQVQSNTSKNNFPNGMTFSLVASSNANISKVRLKFKILPVAITTFQTAQCNGDKNITCSANVGVSRGSYLNPKSQVVYVWDLTDDSGQSIETPEQTVTYEDSRFGWQSKTDGNITVWSYAGSAATITAIQGAAQDSVNNIGPLLHTTIDFPIKVLVYSNARDLQQALAPGSSIYTAGQVSSADTALTSLDQLGISSGLDTIRHEVAHLVTGKASREFIAGVPAWLNEGISVYSQRNFDDGWQQTLDQAIRSNRVLSISSLSESARDANATVNLFYGESGSIVKFMIDTYGKDKFAEFFGNQANSTLDDAIKKAYGFDTLGLENAWRKSVGLPPSTSSGPSGANGSSSASSAPAVPTIVPFGANTQATATPAAGATSSTEASKAKSGNSTLVYGIVAVIVVLVLALGAMLFVMGKGKKTAT